MRLHALGLLCLLALAGCMTAKASIPSPPPKAAHALTEAQRTTYVAVCSRVESVNRYFYIGAALYPKMPDWVKKSEHAAYTVAHDACSVEPTSATYEAITAKALQALADMLSAVASGKQT